MSKSPKFSPEVRERAVRMVQEHRADYTSLWAAIESIAPKIGCVPQTLNDWVKKAEVDSGQRPGTTTSEAQRIKELEVQLKQAQEKAQFFEAVIHVLKREHGVTITKKPAGKSSKKSSSKG